MSECAVADEAVAIVGDFKDAAGGDCAAALAEVLDGAVDHLITAESGAGGHAEEVGEACAFVTVEGLELGDGDVVEGFGEIDDARLTL